jgi:polyhydroxyalkanoate synthesis regulator phasin
MTKGMKWLYVTVGGIGALALVFGAAFLTIQAGDASSSANGASPIQMGAQALGFGKGDKHTGDYDEALAEALGISVEELQAAYEVAHTAAIEQAVKEGLLTQEQADNMLDGGRFGQRGRHGFRPFGGEMNTLLAEALGISVAELESGQEQAQDALIAQAVADGNMTQEQADLLEARQAIQSYVEEAMAEAFAEAVEQAVADGAITQAQADLLLEDGRPGMRGPGGFFGG